MRHPPYLAPARSSADVRSGLGCKEGGKQETVEGSGRGQGSLAKPPPPRQCRFLEGRRPATRPGGRERLRSPGGGRG